MTIHELKILPEYFKAQKAMKVKILVECDPQSLEKEVNEFIADKHVINIKFKINDYPDYLAFVIYEEK